jgi:hypothetical protein
MSIYLLTLDNYGIIPYMNPTQTTPVDAAVSTPIQQTPAPIKLGKFAASYKLVQESWNILKKDTGIAWFPVLSAIASIVAMIILSIAFFVIGLDGSISTLTYTAGDTQYIRQWGYVTLFIYYLVMFFITNYFLAGLYTVVHGRFNGQDLSLRDGLANAQANFEKIFAWSLISATVGLVLQFISDRSALAGKIIASVFGAVWSILTYFSLPSLVIGKKTIKESFKESASLIRKTWGEAIIINFGMGLFFMLIFFGVVAFCIGLVVLVPHVVMFISVAILFIVFMVALAIISSTLQAIFKLALYEYASTGKVPEGFSPELIEGAVRRK